MKLPDSVLAVSPKTTDANCVHIPKPGAGPAPQDLQRLPEAGFAVLNQKGQNENNTL